MYKTVRHGENSLQYTILPQTEEVFSNSGLKGKGRDYSPSIHLRHSRKRPSVKYILLVIIGLVVTLAFAAVPLYIIKGEMYVRNQLQNNELVVSSPRTAAGREIAKTRKKELKMSPDLVSTMISKLEMASSTASPLVASTTVPTTVTSERATLPPWTMPALRSWKSSTSSTTIPPLPTEDIEEIPLLGTPSGSISLLDHYKSLKPWEKDTIIKPTVTPESITLKHIFNRYYSRSFVPSVKTATDPPKVPENMLTTTKITTTIRSPVTTEFTTTSENSRMSDLKDTLLSVDDDDEFKESLEEDEVFSLPPLKPESAAPGVDADEVTVSKAGDSAWYGARWPFVDTSSYFQWTGYSPGDNLLLPLLVAALSSVVLVLLLALAVRKRKRSHSAATHIGLTADLQADDNTNLLTAENPEDAEE